MNRTIAAYLAIIVTVPLSTWMAPAPCAEDRGVASLETGNRHYLAGDYVVAHRNWERAAAAGNTDAMMHLGHLHHRGLGVPVDEVQALKWYLAAADGGSPHAQYHMGFLYEVGILVEADRQTAQRWYAKVVEQGICQSTLRPPDHIR